MVKSLADPGVIEAIKAMIDDTAQGLHVIATGTQGVRHMYSKKEIHRVEDLKGLKVRVQATATEDLMFPAYGAQTVHMPFGSVYTSLQTGVMDVAENSFNVYLVNKHYEVAPVLSLTEHEANNALVFISDKLWQSLSAEQKQWVTTAANEISQKEPAKAFELEKARGPNSRRWASRSSATSTNQAFRKSPIPIWTSSPGNSARMRTRSRP